MIIKWFRKEEVYVTGVEVEALIPSTFSDAHKGFIVLPNGEKRWFEKGELQEHLLDWYECLDDDSDFPFNRLETLTGSEVVNWLLTVMTELDYAIHEFIVR